MCLYFHLSIFIALHLTHWLSWFIWKSLQMSKFKNVKLYKSMGWNIKANENLFIRTPHNKSINIVSLLISWALCLVFISFTHILWVHICWPADQLNVFGIQFSYVLFHLLHFKIIKFISIASSSSSLSFLFFFYVSFTFSMHINRSKIKVPKFQNHDTEIGKWSGVAFTSVY